MKALVLGGSGSIGSEIVKQLLTDGFEVYVQYYRTDINELTSKFNDDKVHLYKRIYLKQLILTKHLVTLNH